MRRTPPAFWAKNGGTIPPLLLLPAAAVVARVTARRLTRPGWRAAVPVICCGNVTVGGSGKTVLALDLLRRLTARGIAAHALSRGYGGSGSGVRPVGPADDPCVDGDEALLLAQVAPTWIGANRAASARAAIATGARALVLDDGLQNPTLCKDLSLLVVDGGFGFGNGRVLPAGPLREPIAAGATRCRAVVLIGDDTTGAVTALENRLPILRARLAPGPEAAALCGRRVLAFAGIGRPQKFFDTVREAGAVIADRLRFPDHHQFTARDLQRIEATAAALDAIPLTTAKDAVRLTREFRARVAVLSVRLVWHDETEIEALLDEVLATTTQ